MPAPPFVTVVCFLPRLSDVRHEPQCTTCHCMMEFSVHKSFCLSASNAQITITNAMMQGIGKEWTLDHRMKCDKWPDVWSAPDHCTAVPKAVKTERVTVKTANAAPHASRAVSCGLTPFSTARKGKERADANRNGACARQLGQGNRQDETFSQDCHWWSTHRSKVGSAIAATEGPWDCRQGPGRRHCIWAATGFYTLQKADMRSQCICLKAPTAADGCNVWGRRGAGQGRVGRWMRGSWRRRWGRVGKGRNWGWRRGRWRGGGRGRRRWAW